jgi:hypothetical protein
MFTHLGESCIDTASQSFELLEHQACVAYRVGPSIVCKVEKKVDSDSGPRRHFVQRQGKKPVGHGLGGQDRPSMNQGGFHDLPRYAACRANARDVMAKFFGLSRSPRWGRFSQKSDAM